MIYNYSSYAIDDFFEWSRRYKQKGGHHTANMYQVVADLLKEDAVKFALPDGGRLFTGKHSLSPEDSDLLHLPFPVIALEYFVSSGPIHDPVQQCDAPKRICLALENSDSSLGNEAGIFVIPSWYDNAQKIWVLPASQAFIPKRQDHSPDSLCRIDIPSFTKSDLCIQMVPLLKEEYDYGVQQYGVNEMERRGFLDVIDEVNSLLCFLHALSCTNVLARESQDQKDLDKINRKRLQKGKRPFFTYKILEIVVPIERSSKQEPSGDEKKRNPPRMHLRRGHIRRLPSGKRLWINACVVGNRSKGLIKKDYRVVPIKLKSEP
jgi:hypothetical protein